MAIKQSKALKGAYEKFDKEKAYTTTEAVKILKDTITVKFDATAEVHFTLGIDPKHADQQIRTTTSLPNGTGKDVKVVVFCEDDKVAAAKAAGAIDAGGTELIDKVIKKGWTDFDVAVATPTMMKNLAKAARVLGPRGLMPNPKSGTVTPEVEKAVKELSAGRIEFRNDKAGLIHTIFGKSSFTEAQLVENLDAMIKSVKDAKPSGVKGNYIQRITVCSSMGPGIKIEIGE